MNQKHRGEVESTFQKLCPLISKIWCDVNHQVVLAGRGVLLFCELQKLVIINFCHYCQHEILTEINKQIIQILFCLNLCERKCSRGIIDR